MGSCRVELGGQPARCGWYRKREADHDFWLVRACRQLILIWRTADALFYLHFKVPGGHKRLRAALW